LTLAGSAETSLASLVGATSGSVTQNLYFWANAYAAVPADTIGVLAATITTSYNGTSVVTAATPIPPAFFLMGSGLLGMFGLRRKNKVA
jgi:FtsH-binding integral membrane protein